MLNHTGPRPIDRLAREFYALKARTIAQNDTDSDLDKCTDACHLREVKTNASESPDANDLLTMTTDSKADFSKGVYSENLTVQWFGKVIEFNTSFQERPDGRVETLQQSDLDADGKVDHVTRQIFTPIEQEGFLLAQ